MTILSNISKEERINAVRHFNRFMTKQIGALRESLLHSPYSLTESRIIFEIANNNNLTASNLIHDLGLDAGYVSRILARFEEKGIIQKERSTRDARQLILKLTLEGVKAFSQLNERSNNEIAELIGELSESEQQQLINALKTVEGLLIKKKSLKFSGPYFLRQHEPGDMGWVVHKHGILYSQEYGWDVNFESLVSQIVADFIDNYNPKRERCWIAEMNGEIVGSIFVVEGSEDTAKLRLLIVDPKARGLGLGSQLVEECINFSRRVGYKKLVLWTNSVLKEARHIYQKKGFTLVDEEKHHSFGKDLVGETWELSL
ncbi:bifunctional helix-turn-helix transcriptional regulator/GNAT family N-acetyltransferase [Alkalihalobacterium alkalinitrilicum]|uniref:bifunctional helix-turn-helix transcriptional regulator/GNAT family N-acetyltransferase n=1 Tax=Alkalihalobacterium alkalinitrilicum TaxID=427920 RepID=UPI001EE405F0|nr:bifunctional helix-turn-helix transcriptional regulator/GNAT family N-acetyltransferase [Alkalihalobacterium alkalinitrilicum]